MRCGASGSSGTRPGADVVVPESPGSRPWCHRRRREQRTVTLSPVGLCEPLLALPKTPQECQQGPPELLLMSSMIPSHP